MRNRPAWWKESKIEKKRLDASASGKKVPLCWLKRNIVLCYIVSRNEGVLGGCESGGETERL